MKGEKSRLLDGDDPPKTEYGISERDPPATEKDTKVAESSESKKPKEIVSFSSLFRFADGFDKFLMFFGTICAIVNGASRPVITLLFGNMINVFIEFQMDLISSDQLMDKLETYAVYYTIGGGIVFLFAYGETAAWMTTGERQSRRIRLSYFESLLRQDIEFFDSHTSGELTTRVNADTELIQEGISDKVGNLFRVLAIFFGGFGIAFAKGWKLTLVLMSVVPLLAVAGAILGKLIVAFVTKGQEVYAEAGSIAKEVLSQIRTVAAYNGYQRESFRYDQSLVNAQKLGEKQGRTQGLSMGVTMLIMFCSYGLGFWYGGRLISRHEYNGGEVVTVFFTVMMGGFSLGQAQPFIEAITNARGAAYKIWSTIDTPPTPRDPLAPLPPTPSEGVFSAGGKGVPMVRFEGVKFEYPKRRGVPVLEGLDMEIRRGEKVALVGPSGCGKSTVVSLLLRFYDTNSGSIYLSSQPIRSIHPQLLRNKIGVVTQEPVLFNLTVEENIRLGTTRENVTREEIEEVARVANAHSFIETLEKGYDTPVGEKGTQLSGGQKQRIAIARALINKPSLLIFDEATSALDADSEAEVQRALDIASKNVTTLIIAHRLSTIRNASRIYVLKGGVCVESGTHDELVGKVGGMYRDLFEAQMAAKGKASDKSASKSVGDPSTSDAKKDTTVDVDTDESSPSHEKTSSKKAQKVLKNVTLGRLFRLNSSENVYTFTGIFASAVNGLVFPLYSILFSQMMEIFSETDPALTRDVRFWSLMFLGLALLTFLTNFFSAWTLAVAGERLTRRLRRESLISMMRMEMGWFDKRENRTGALTSKLALEATLIRGMYGSRLASMLSILFTIVASVTIAYVNGWELSTVVLGCVPFVAFGGLLQMRSIQGSSAHIHKAYASAGGLLSDALEGVRTLSALGAQRWALGEYTRALEDPYREGMKRARVAGMAVGLSMAFIFGAYAVSFYYGGLLVSQYEMSYLQMMRVFSAIIFGAMSLGQMASFMPDMAKAKQAAVDIFSIIDRQPHIDPYAESGEREGRGVHGKVEFRNVSFSYPSRPNEPVLQNLSFVVEPGKTVAIVGHSGSGKSTIISLIERFYDPTEGEVLLDDLPLPAWHVPSARQRLSLVSQEPALFNMSLAENIAYGRRGERERDTPSYQNSDGKGDVYAPKRSRELQTEIENAARMANAHDFIQGFTGQYELLPGEGGGQLSGGQKQRVALARAIIRRPEVLLLDEATSALDAQSEKEVQSALHSLSSGRSTIIVAHRLSTIRHADTIVVMKAGRAVERGTHEDLMNARGEYFSLVKAQMD